MHSRLRHAFAATLAAVVVATAAVGVVAAATAPVAGGPAGADTCTAQAAAVRSAATVANLRAFGDCEIDRRQTTLGQLASAVGASAGLTSSDAAALSALISGDATGLASLKTTIDGAATAAALRLDIAQIVTRFRVYELLGPQVRLTIAADDVLALKPHFDGIATRLAGRIAAARTAGKDVAAAQASLDAMNAAVTAAVGLASPWPAELLALTPAGYGGAESTALQNARSDLGQARDDLKAAAQDGRNVLLDLK